MCVFVPCIIGDKAKNVNPYADVGTPEIIIYRSRIFGPKYEHISGNSDGIQIEQALGKNSILKDNLRETKLCRQWTKHISYNIRKQNEWQLNSSYPEAMRY